MAGSYQNFPHAVNGNNGSINGRGIKRRDLTHDELVDLALDAVDGTHPVVLSLSQASKVFEGVTQNELSERRKQREVARRDAEAEKALFNFADVWSERSPVWQAEALKWIADGPTGAPQMWGASFFGEKL
jgi:uncharacterized protein (DUF2384 family)